MSLATTSLDIFRLLFWDRAIFQETMEAAWVRHSVIGGGRTCLKTWPLVSMTGPQGYVPIAVVMIASIILQVIYRGSWMWSCCSCFHLHHSMDLQRSAKNLEWFGVILSDLSCISWDFLGDTIFDIHPTSHPLFSKSLSRLAQWSPHEREQNENAEDHLQPQSFLAGICRKTPGKKHGTIMGQYRGKSWSIRHRWGFILDVVDSWMDWCNVIQSTHQSTWWQSKLPLCWCRHWHSSSMKKTTPCY